MTDADKVRLDFLAKGIFERRKTQYVFFLFYLGAAGTCASVVLSADKPETRLLILLVPVVLQLPVYFTWWYQRNQIYRIDDARLRLLGVPNSLDEAWQARLGKYANDLVILLVPGVFVGLAWLIRRDSPDGVLANNDFLALLCVAIATSALSFLVGAVCHIKRWRTASQSRTVQ